MYPENSKIPHHYSNMEIEYIPPANSINVGINMIDISLRSEKRSWPYLSLSVELVASKGKSWFFTRPEAGCADNVKEGKDEETYCYDEGGDVSTRSLLKHVRWQRMLHLPAHTDPNHNLKLLCCCKGSCKTSGLMVRFPSFRLGPQFSDR